MFPYYFLIGFPMLLSLFPYNDDRKVLNRRFPLLVFFLIFIALLSLRGVSCGVDLLTYRYKFNHPSSLNLLSLFDFSITEPGFLLLTALIKKLRTVFSSI